MQTYADSKTVCRRLDIGSVFLDSEGDLNRDLMKDAVHPNVKGYCAMSEAMEPMIKDLLDE